MDLLKESIEVVKIDPNYPGSIEEIKEKEIIKS